jgi:alpha-L-rhamnosidase
VWLPYQLYLMYGDKQIVADHYETAKRWLNFSLSCMKEVNPRYADRDYYRNGDGDYIYDTRFHYGEWNEPLPPAPEVIELFMKGGTAADYVTHMAQYGKPEVATAYTKRSCDNVAHMAEILGKTEDAEYYRSLSAKIKAAYNKYLIAPNGEIQKGHQAAYIRALALDMVSEDKKPLVINQLKKELEAANYHLNTGFLSTVYLLPTLCDNGMTEEAFRILEQTTAPGWLHPVIMGATTMLENWDGLDVFRGSFNHYSFGAVCQFLFEYVAGIRPTFDAPGFQKILLKPVPGGSLTWAEASYKSKQGLIYSGWKTENGKFKYHCTIPCNATACLVLPDGSNHELAAGEYHFEIDWRK